VRGGYVRQRPNGRWIARVRDADGKQIAKTFDTEKAARSWVTEQDVLKTVRSGPDPFAVGPAWGQIEVYEQTGKWPEEEGPGRTVSTYAREMIAAQDLRPTTLHAYRQSLRLYIDGTELGKTPVGSLTPDHINRWWARVKDSGRNNAHQVLSKVLQSAVLLGDRPDNPLKRCPDVKRKRKRTEVEPLTVAEIEALADAAGAERRGVSEYVRERDRLLVLVMGYAGLRAGEAAALRPSDLVNGCRLRVHRAVNKVTGEDAYVGEPKSDAGKRTVTVACSLWDDLKAFAVRFNVPATAVLFHGKDDALLHHKAVNHTVSGAGERIGLDVNSHQLRHSAVSLLIDGGANPRQVQTFVGHSDIRMTLGTYGHLFDQSGQDLANIMENLREQHRNGS